MDDQRADGLGATFMRNGLTRSFEVGQIAKPIALRLNTKDRLLQPTSIPLDARITDSLVTGWAV